MEKPSAEAYVANNKSLVAIPSDFNMSSSATSSAIAFRKGSTSLVNKVNKTVDRIKKAEPR
jgi:arginine/lysine/histidine transporter system substrate-binding protein